MDLKLVKQVIDIMKRSGLTEFEFEEDGFKLRLSSKGDIQQVPIFQNQGNLDPISESQNKETVKNDLSQIKEDSSIGYIKSPMVGTFYSAASPDSKNFVETSSKVKKETIVCIIEAMKVMNEIQSEINGTITEILVNNGDSVEFGQPLFKYKKA